MTEESNKKRSDTLVGREFSEETKAKMSAWQKGIPKSEESKAKRKKTMEDYPILECPHCDMESKNPSNMTRYHFDNCKYKPTSNYWWIKYLGLRP